MDTAPGNIPLSPEFRTPRYQNCKSRSFQSPHSQIRISQGQNFGDITPPITDTDDVRIRTEIRDKLLYLIIFVPVMALSIYLLRDTKSARYKVGAIAFGWVATIFYITWFYMLWTTSKLHGVKVITGKLKPDYGNMIFPTKIKQYPYKPVTSMSALFAVRGSSMHLLFCISSISSGCISSFCIVMHWIDQYQNHSLGIVYGEEYWQFMAIFGALGPPIIANFDLNFDSKCHVFMHYVGVVMLGLSVFPFGIQQNWNGLSVFLIVCGWSFLIIWSVLNKYFPKDLSMEVLGERTKEDVKKKVHRISLICILMETFGTIFVSINCGLFGWNLEDIPTDCT